MTTTTAKASSIADMLAQFKLEDKGGYISQEFQDFGYRLAMELDDEKHKSLYMKMAKNVPRGLLEQSLSYVKDAREVKSKARLFMWKLKQLQEERQKTKDAAAAVGQSRPSEQVSLFGDAESEKT